MICLFLITLTREMGLFKLTLQKFLLILIANTSILAGSSQETCSELKRFLSDSIGNIECLGGTFHLNSKSVNKYYSYQAAMKQKNVRISAFNVYQSGSTRTEYKDYKLVAKVMNNWDVVGATELVPIIGIDNRHNNSIIGLLNKIEKSDAVPSFNEQMPELTRNQKIKLLKSQYEKPGYIKILVELQKLDPSWSLLLSASEDGAAGATVHELAGYFYRAKVVTPVQNDYCYEFYKDKRKVDDFSSCQPLYSKKFYGKDISNLVSRKPYMGSFKSGKFDFTLLLTHVVYNSPSDPDLRKKILRAAFGVDDYSEVGQGVTGETYARFAEVFHILNFSEKMKKAYKEQDIIIMGDLNLESSNNYWSTLLDKFSGSEIKIEGETSLSKSRTRSDGSSTHGTSQNFDHFIFNPTTISQCAGDKNARIYNFLENSMSRYVDYKYLVRGEDDYVDSQSGVVMYSYRVEGEEKQNDFISDYLRTAKEKYTVKKGRIVKRYDLKSKRDDILRKIFSPQFYERSYYRVYQEVLSDHLPIYMSCENTHDTDK